MMRPVVRAAMVAFATWALVVVPVGVAGARSVVTRNASISTHDVARGGIVTFTGTCASSGADLMSANLRVDLQSAPAPYDVNRVVPLWDSGSFVADMAIPVDAPSGDYTATVECVQRDTAAPAPIDQPQLKVESSSIAPPGTATISAPLTVEQGAVAFTTVTCPPSTPAADAAVVIASVPVGGVPGQDITSALLDASGTFRLPLFFFSGPKGAPPPYEPLGTWHVALYCRAGSRYLAPLAATTISVLAAVTTTTTTTAATSSTTTAPRSGNSAPGATPVPGASTFTG